MLTELRAWTIKDSIELYNVGGWGRDFFTINEKGNVEVTPAGPGSVPIDLKELVDDLRSRGLNLPMLIGSPTSCACVSSSSTGFDQAIVKNEYTGGYPAVYPIKVNQQRHVVEEIVEFGKAHGLQDRGWHPSRSCRRSLAHGRSTPSISSFATGTRTTSSCDWR